MPKLAWTGWWAWVSSTTTTTGTWRCQFGKHGRPPEWPIGRGPRSNALSAYRGAAGLRARETIAIVRSETYALVGADFGPPNTLVYSSWVAMRWRRSSSRR